MNKFQFEHAWVDDDEGLPVLSLEPGDLLADGFTRYRDWFASRKTLMEALHIEQERLINYDPATHPTAKWLANAFPKAVMIHTEIAEVITIEELMHAPHRPPLRHHLAWQIRTPHRSPEKLR